MMSTKPCERKLFQSTDHVPVQSKGHWVGIEPMTWVSQPQTQTAQPVGSNQKLFQLCYDQNKNVIEVLL